MCIFIDIKRGKDTFMSMALVYEGVDNVPILSVRNLDLEHLNSSQINPDLKVIQQEVKKNVYTCFLNLFDFIFSHISYM